MMTSPLSTSVSELLKQHRAKCEDKIREICASYGSKAAYRKTLQVEHITRAEDPTLEQFYQLYLSNFTLKHEQESLDGFAKVLGFNWDLQVQADYGPLSEKILCLRDPANDELIGAANFVMYAYPGQQDVYSGYDASCQLNFLVVRDTLRGVGIAFDLLRLVEEEVLKFAGQHTPRKSFKTFTTIEMNDPSRMTIDELQADATSALIDPGDRTTWWVKQGFNRLDLPYVQPALTAGGHACRYLDFLISCTPPLGEGLTRVPSATLEEHLRRFFYVSVGKFETDMDQNSEWRDIKNFLSQNESVEVVFCHRLMCPT